MRIKYFNNVRFKNDWEMNFVGKVWNLRIGRSQFALWKNFIAVFNFCKGNNDYLRAESLD